MNWKNSPKKPWLGNKKLLQDGKFDKLFSMTQENLGPDNNSAYITPEERKLHDVLIRALVRKDGSFARDLIDQIPIVRGQGLLRIFDILTPHPSLLALYIETMSDEEFELLDQSILNSPESSGSK